MAGVEKAATMLPMSPKLIEDIRVVREYIERAYIALSKELLDRPIDPFAKDPEDDDVR